MPKPQREPAKPPNQPVRALASSEMLDQTRATMGKACVMLDKCVDRVSEMLEAGEYSKDLASHLAWITKQLAGVTGELRKLEAHEDKTASKLSPEKRDQLVMAYLKGLTGQRRTAIIAQLQGMNAPGSVLG